MDDIEKLFNVRIDRARLQTLDPVEQSIQMLNLPTIRFRKLNTILNALKMQIEEGGDNPAVNGYLVKALRAAVVAQMGEVKGKSVLEALDRFERAEKDRSQKPRNPPQNKMPEDPVQSLNLFIEAGYRAMEPITIWPPVKGMVGRLGHRQEVGSVTYQEKSRFRACLSNG